MVEQALLKYKDGSNYLERLVCNPSGGPIFPYTDAPSPSQDLNPSQGRNSAVCSVKLMVSTSQVEVYRDRYSLGKLTLRKLWENLTFGTFSSGIGNRQGGLGVD